MELYQKLRANARQEDWTAGLIWCGWGVLGGLLPLWGTAIIFLLLHQPLSWDTVTKNGEFVLYAASFLGGSLYTIRRDVFPNRNFLSILFLGALSVSAIVFAAVTVASIAAHGGTVSSILTIDPDILLRISVVLLAIAVLFGYLTTVADSANIGFDLGKAKKNELETLNRQLDRL